MSSLTQQETYAQLGGIIRQLHDALESLGYDRSLRQIATEIPDARDRLTYVSSMTEAAASKVLNLVDAAVPACAELTEQCEEIQATVDRTLHDAPKDAAPVLQKVVDFTRRTTSFAETQQAVLTDIMMAQDFQDLSGQVIGKVIDIISRTEKQLVELLVNVAPEQPAQDPEALAGPQIPEKAMRQDDVDDLLASLGF